jgi:hypothetical protein
MNCCGNGCDCRTVVIDLALTTQNTKITNVIGGGHIFDYLFMILIIFLSLYNLFLKRRNDEEWKELNPKSLTNIYRFHYFGVINSFFGGYIFGIEWLYWITLYSVLGILICFKTKNNNNSTKIVLVILLLIFFSIYRVPTHPASFQNYISSKEAYQCVNNFECVIISTNITPEDTVETVAEVIPIKVNSFNWYLLFSKGSLKLEYSDGFIEELKGINIAGFWIEY